MPQEHVSDKEAFCKMTINPHAGQQIERQHQLTQFPKWNKNT